jgi:phage major head subunit gpT-like protein
MALITPTLLGSINNGLSLAYNTQFFATTSLYKTFCLDVESTGDTEVYPRLDMIRGVREWIGAREVQQLSQLSFTIQNKKFEETIAIARTDIEDDKYGIYTPAARMLGESAAQLPDILVANLLKAGTTTKTYDGQNFFDTAHPTYDGSGNATTVANYAAGSSPGWYLMDTTRVVKPLIFQTREPFQLTARVADTDPNVFDRDEYVWGVRGRCNAGLALWQFAYYSTQPMTPANLVAARTAMSSIRRPDGTPMGIVPNKLVVPSSLFPRAGAYFRNSLIANDPTTPTVLVENDIIGMFEPVEYRWLN